MARSVLTTFIAIGAVSLLMAGCDSLYAFGDSEEAETKATNGNRIPILLKQESASINPSLSGIDVVLPSADALAHWRQVGASATHAIEHVYNVFRGHVSRSAFGIWATA